MVAAPADGFSSLQYSAVVKQYFAAPASTAGVECVFSAAGKINCDLSKSAKDDTLEASIIAAHNTP